MNSANPSPVSMSRQAGNAMVYILIALALLAALTMMMTRQSDQGGDDVSADQAKILTNTAIGYAGTADNVVQQMINSGSSPANIDFTLPTDATFNTAPFINKLYHPQGGGLNYVAGSPANPFFDYSVLSSNPTPGWYVGRPSNVEWTPTTAKDIIAVAYLISKSVCENLNKTITGSTTIPIVATGLKNVFVDGSLWSGTNSDLTSTNCAACKGYTSLCVSRGTADAWAFYTIIEGL